MLKKTYRSKHSNLCFLNIGVAVIPTFSSIMNNKIPPIVSSNVVCIQYALNVDLHCHLVLKENHH